MALSRSIRRLFIWTRSYATAPIRRGDTTTDKRNLNEIYAKTKQKFESKKLPLDVNPTGVFACNELDLKELNVYGFDYDYTLACYTDSLNYLLYELGRDILIKRFKYPQAIGKLEYIPNWAVRGLHYDIEKGLLLKLDSFMQIQLGSVYRGLTQLTDDEVLHVYKNRIIPLAYVEGNKSGVNGKMVQLADLFSVPEMCLLSRVLQYLQEVGADYHPEILFRDIKQSVGASHPLMHKQVAQEVCKYIHPKPRLSEFFDRLVSAKKQLFLVTNSPFDFVDKGMSMLVGSKWREYFDVVIVSARKPRFFTDENRPIRLCDEKPGGGYLWDRVTKLEKGRVYCEGTVKQLQDLMGWSGKQVLYYGDHPYSDLADVTLEHGWRTAAIISELKHEIESLNDPTFKRNANWLQMLTQLIEDHQDDHSAEGISALARWTAERDTLRHSTKKVFNEQFGSVFRTFHNPTYFSRRLFRFSDIYTADICNMLNHSLTHTFYPRRGVMPHEYSSYFM